MKRNIRVILLLALVVFMLGVTMLVAAATNYFEVTDATGASVGTYETPETALAAVTGNGYTVKLLEDVNLGKNKASGDALSCSVDFTYTIDGNGHTINLTELKTPARVNGIAIKAGNVTFKNVTVTTTQEAIKNLIYFSPAATTSSLTFENTTVQGGKVQILNDKAGTMTFKGNGNVIGKDNNATAACAISLKNNTAAGKVIVEGGQFIARSPLFEAAGATIEIRGGTFENSTGSALFVMADANFVSAVKILDGTFTLNRGGMFFNYSGAGDCVGFAANGNALINISGGQFTHYGSGHLFNITATSVADKSASGGTMSAVGYPVIKITDGGTSTETRLLNADGTGVAVKLPLFDGWPDEDSWAPGAWKSAQVGEGIGTINSDVFYINNSKVHLDIAGGTYIGSPYTYSLVEMAPAAATNFAEVNISGGAFRGGQSWIRMWNASVCNISGTGEFSNPAPRTYPLDLGAYDISQGVMTSVDPIALHPGSGRNFVLDAASQKKQYRNVLDEAGRPVYELNEDGTVKTDESGNPVIKQELAKDGTVISYGRAGAGQLNITGGTVNLTNGATYWIWAAGADVNISGGTFNIGCRGIKMDDTNSVSYVYITGGTFNGSGNFQLIYYSASNGYKSESSSEQSVKYNQYGLVEISGGTFVTTEKCTALYYNCSLPKRPTVGGLYDGYVRITGGTFRSEGIYLINVPSSMKGEFVIENGTFEGTASRLVMLSGYKGQFSIKGGAFHLSAVPEGKRVTPTDTIIYLKTTARETVLNIEDGTFINEREGAGRLIMFDSKTATLNLAGGKFMSRSTLENYLERYMNHGNMPANPELEEKETVEGVEYSVAYVHAPSGAYAPVMNADIGVRIDNETPGIRFTSYVSHEKLAALSAAGGTDVAYGTLIVPREYLLQITDFTDVIGQLKAIAAAAGVAESKVFADVAASAGLERDVDGNVTFRAALVGITNASKGYGAISYVKATVGGQTVYCYSGLNTASNISSLKAVVTRELHDTNDKPEEVDFGTYVYKYNSIYSTAEAQLYSRYTKPEQKYLKQLIGE